MKHVRYETVDKNIREHKKYLLIVLFLNAFSIPLAWASSFISLHFKEQGNIWLEMIFFVCLLGAIATGIVSFMASIKNIWSLKKLKKLKPILEKDHKQVNAFEEDLQNCIANNNFLIKENKDSHYKIMFIMNDYVVGYQEDPEGSKFVKILKSGKEDESFIFSETIRYLIKKESYRIFRNKEKLDENSFFNHIKEVLKSNQDEKNNFDKNKKQNTNISKSSMG